MTDSLVFTMRPKQKPVWRYFVSSAIVTALGLAFAAFVGWNHDHTAAAVAEALIICLVLSTLETSLSFDNAVVNARILSRMSPLWQHRFLTWGMLIAVVGIRLILPLAIVGIVARINPWQALVMAAFRQDEYAAVMKAAHVPVAGFGGAFLLMVALKYFFDSEKDSHWLHIIESPLSNLGKLRVAEFVLVLAASIGVSRFLHDDESMKFWLAAVAGLFTFVAVDILGRWLERGAERNVKNAHLASAGLFIYLEVLDASFSFDGVVGAFAISHNLFIISIGLGIGAMFVRSLTLLLVERGTLTHYIYLEHGAFYAIAALGFIMYLDVVVPVPELVTGLIGSGFLAAAFFSSVRHNRLNQHTHQAFTEEK